MNAKDLTSSLRRKVRRSVERRGVAKTAGYFVYRAFLMMLGRAPVNDFDKRYGTNTSGEVKLGALNVKGSNTASGIPYTGTPIDVFERFFRGAPMRHEAFTFVDFGSGKGLATMLASNFPFRKIVGVEFAPELIEAAKANVAKYRGSAAQRCTDIEFVCADATEYPLPEDPCVFYFFNPFVKEVMQAVVRRVEQSLRECPREAWVVYINPVEHPMFDAVPLLERIECGANIAVYHYAPSGVHARKPCRVSATE